MIEIKVDGYTLFEIATLKDVVHLRAAMVAVLNEVV